MTRTALLITSGDGPAECRQAVGHVLDRLCEDAAGRGVALDVTERPGTAGPASAIAVLSGQAAPGLARAWTGVVRWRCPSALRPRHRRKNWFVEIFSLDPPPRAVTVRPGDLDLSALRAGGPGGQHQNTTDSAVRARWRHPDGTLYTVVVRDERSQHRNRSIALERLQALVDHDAAEAEASARAATRRLHHALERGNPSRAFEGPAFREVPP